MRAHFILYVADQRLSTEFYSAVLGVQPRLDVPGMTEFCLNDGSVLGLMPRSGAARLLGIGSEELADAGAIAKAELYLMVQNPAAYHARSLTAYGREISALSARDWGHTAAYSYDPDGYVLAFAVETRP